jgi:hypothetical protein
MKGFSMEIIIVFLIVAAPVLAIFLWWKVFNSPNGERYLKMQTQGPFVPANGDVGPKDESHTNGSASS